jgi:hypothetical protein
MRKLMVAMFAFAVILTACGQKPVASAGAEPPSSTATTTTTTPSTTTSSSTTTSTSTTSTTSTLPVDPSLVFHPNDFVCGMGVERRYELDSERPAPLGAIWRTHDKSVALSAILVGYGKDSSQYSDDYADFCFGDDRDGNPIVVRFQLNRGNHAIIVGIYGSTGTDLLPFGNSIEAQSLTTGTRDEPVDRVLDRLVIGRQYVFDISWGVFCGDYDESGNVVEIDCPFDDLAVWRYISGQTDSLPEKPGMILAWYGMPGHI